MLLATYPSKMINIFISLQGNVLVHLYEKEKKTKPQPKEAANTAAKIDLHTFLSCLPPLAHFFLLWNVFISLLITFKNKEKRKE